MLILLKFSDSCSVKDNCDLKVFNSYLIVTDLKKMTPESTTVTAYKTILLNNSPRDQLLLLKMLEDNILQKLNLNTAVNEVLD